jgi:hypothetical protein
VVACSLYFACFIVSKHIHSCLSSAAMNARGNKLTGTIPQGVGLLSLLGTFFTDGHLTRGGEFLLGYALTFFAFPASSTLLQSRWSSTTMI